MTPAEPIDQPDLPVVHGLRVVHDQRDPPGGQVWRHLGQLLLPLALLRGRRPGRQVHAAEGGAGFDKELAQAEEVEDLEDSIFVYLLWRIFPYCLSSIGSQRDIMDNVYAVFYTSTPLGNKSVPH